MGSAKNGGVSVRRPKGAKLVHPPPWDVYDTFPKLEFDTEDQVLFHQGFPKICIAGSIFRSN